MNTLIKLTASVFYLGYIPFIPGTIASAFALMLYFVFAGNPILYTFLLLVVCALGFASAGRAERIFQQKDCNKIVIDEVAGLLLAFWALPHLDMVLIITGFFIFRALDAVKVYPANLLEKLEGSAGIMADDLMAGLYTNIVLQIVTRMII